MSLGTHRFAVFARRGADAAARATAARGGGARRRVGLNALGASDGVRHRVSTSSDVCV